MNDEVRRVSDDGVVFVFIGAATRGRATFPDKLQIHGPQVATPGPFISSRELQAGNQTYVTKFQKCMRRVRRMREMAR